MKKEAGSMNRIPKTGDLYTDGAGRIYQVIVNAVYAETGEPLVVYQEMSGNFQISARPLQQFTGENGQERLFEKTQKKQEQPDAEKISSQTDTAAAPGKKEPAGQPVFEQNQNLQQRQISAVKKEPAPRTQSPAESKRAFRQITAETAKEGASYYEKRRRQMEEREQRREMFRKTQRHESATEELRANPCLMKFLEADTYEEKYHVLNEIQNDMTDRLIDDIAVVLDVVIPEGAMNDRFHQLRNIILTRQKYETSRFR